MRPTVPYINWLAQHGASLTGMYAITHGSQVDMLHFFSGANQGVTDSNVPLPCAVTSATSATSLIAAGNTFVTATASPLSVRLSRPPARTRKHNPYTHWKGQHAIQALNQLPPSVNQPFTAFPSDFSQLPTVAYVVPNLDNDMHDGTIRQADQWLRPTSAPTPPRRGQTHNSLLIVTWDEDDGSEGNRIPTIFSGPMVRTGQISSVRTLHDLLRTVEDLYGTSHAGAAASVSSITGAFTTDPRTTTLSFLQRCGRLRRYALDLPRAGCPQHRPQCRRRAVTNGSPCAMRWSGSTTSSAM